MSDDARPADTWVLNGEAAAERREPTTPVYASVVNLAAPELHIYLPSSDWAVPALMKTLSTLLSKYPKTTRVVIDQVSQDKLGASDILSLASPTETGRVTVLDGGSLVVVEPPVRTMGDPLAAARWRGEQAMRDILAIQGDLLDASEVASRLKLSPADIEQRRQDGLLLALPLDNGSFGFPAWQFADGGLLPGLEPVFRDMGVRDPWMQAEFFLNDNIDLDARTPLEMLLKGEARAVRRAAAMFGEHVAS